MNQLATELQSRITNHTAKVGIIGLGYVGLPLALAFAEKDFPVLGFDVDQSKIDNIASGTSYIKHLDPQRLKAQTTNPNFEATADFTRLSEERRRLQRLAAALAAFRQAALTQEPPLIHPRDTVFTEDGGKRYQPEPNSI